MANYFRAITHVCEKHATAHTGRTLEYYKAEPAIPCDFYGCQKDAKLTVIIQVACRKLREEYETTTAS